MNMALPLQISAYCFCCDCLVEADCLLSAAALHCEDNQCTIRVKGNALQRRPGGEIACTVHTAENCAVRCRQLQCVLRCVRHGVTQDRSRWIGPRLSTFSKMVHIPTNTDPILTTATTEYGYSILAKYSSESFIWTVWYFIFLSITTILCFLTLELKTRNVFPSEVQIISTIKEFIAPIMATINALNILLWQLNATNSRLSIMPPRVAEIW